MSSKQRLVLSIIDFLNQSIQDGTVKSDDAESLEVAIQCIGEAFGVDPSDDTQRNRLTVKPATLPSIFDVFLKTREKHAAGPSASTSAPRSTSTPSVPKGPSAEDKVAAETFKAKGNTLMSGKKFDDAIVAYTKAIDLDPTNAVYYSNRAAAYSSQGGHNEAILDAEKAIEVDPSFIKAYHRLGHAQYCLSDYRAAAAAFRRGLELDPPNTSLKAGLQNAEARITDNDVDDVPDSPPEATSQPAPGSTGGGLEDMLRGVGAGGGGGMPDLASLMNNPMMMQMAQQMMANGGLDRLMSNPSVANMMDRMQSGGGLPDMSELMSDPTLRNLASQFGAGRGAGQ